MAVQLDPPDKSSWSLRNVASLPPKWLHKYEDFVTKNASQVSQIESTLRSLTYIIPGRFRDAEIASESIHSGVQLLSLYHDTLLLRASASLSKSPSPAPARAAPSVHGRYTRFWALKSGAYRRVAYLLQVVQYTELLCEMAAKRRGERARWRVVILLEAVKALCRLLLLRITRSRPLVSPPLPEREPIPEPAEDDEDSRAALAELMGEETREEEDDSLAASSTTDHLGKTAAPPNGRPVNPNTQAHTHTREWHMPRTGMSLPSLPDAGDISSYLLARVLAADDVKPATRLLNRLRGPSAHAAEVLHILAPLAFAAALARSNSNGNSSRTNGSKKNNWYPWLLGFGLELAARQLRDQQGLRTTALERDEWGRRGRAMLWWAMRGPAYEMFVKGAVGGVKRRVPGLVAGILEDYEYLWENYYFSTSP